MIKNIMQLRVQEAPITWGDAARMYGTWAELAADNATWAELANRKRAVVEVKITANTWGDISRSFLTWQAMIDYYVTWKALTLGSNVDRVVGTVNGQDYEFSYNGVLWSASVPPSADGVYHIETNAYYHNAWIAVARSTVYRQYAAIYDRTRADVEKGTAKGYYNTSDLNRIEYDCEYLQERLSQHGYHATLKPRETWAWLMNDFPTREDTKRLLNNVQSLIDTFHIFSNTPKLPVSMSGMGYQAANDIEKIIADIRKALDYMISQFIYSNDIYAGEW